MSSPCDTFFSIPELPQILSSFVPRDDLYRCIQVSTLWYKLFLPSLWKSFTSLNGPSWSYGACLAMTNRARNGHDLDWFRSAFKKHAHFIKNLVVQTEFLLEVVDEKNYCQPIAKQRLPTLNSPISTNNLDLTSLKITSLHYKIYRGDGMKIHRALANRCWEFIRNQKHLKVLNISDRVGWNDNCSEEDFLSNKLVKLVMDNFHSLTSLTKLVIMTEHKRILFPAIIQQSTALSTSESILMHNLREVEIVPGTYWDSFINLLECAPSLYTLNIGSIRFRGNLPILTESRYQGLSSQLQILKYWGRDKNEKTASFIMPFVPNLVEFIGSYLPLQLSLAISSNCKFIKRIVIGESAHKRSIYYRDEWIKEDVITPLLISCQDLMVLDANISMLDASYTLTQSWVCSNLGELHCWVAKVPYFEKDEMEEVDRIIQEGNKRVKPLSKDKEELIRRFNNMKELKQGLFKQLSLMTLLRRLSISCDYRSSNNGSMNYKWPSYTSERDGKRYTKYDDPPNDALTMRLDDGLDQLASLTQLEFLGFEHLDHKMENEEINWMATNLPCLKEMRGLMDRGYAGLEPNYKNRELLALMERLRKDVKHSRCFEPTDDD